MGVSDLEAYVLKTNTKQDKHINLSMQLLEYSQAKHLYEYLKIYYTDYMYNIYA